MAAARSGHVARGLLLASALASVVARPARAGAPPLPASTVSLAATATAYEAALVPDANTYAAPSTVWRDAGGRLHASTVCGGYVALLATATFPAVTPSALRALTGSPAPHSGQWHAAIGRSARAPLRGGAVALRARLGIADLAVGDILAAAYDVGDVHGHTMVVGRVRLDRADVATTIPGLARADRYRVVVHDSTATPHGPTDSRWQVDRGGHDQGVGRGEIYVFAAPATGALVGWTWSVTSPTIFQGTSPTAAHYRPLLAATLLVEPSTPR
jgi:hypothetical protein